MATYTFWQDQVFTKPVEGWNGLIARSQVITNGGASADNSCKVIVQYKNFTPDGASVVVGYAIVAVLEENIENTWIPVAAQFDFVKGSDKAESQIITLSPAMNFDEGVPIRNFIGSKEVSAISRTQGNLGGSLRVSVYIHTLDEAKPDLESIQLTGVMRTYKE